MATAMAMTALALVVVQLGEDPAAAAGALQLSTTASALAWPGRAAALGYQALRSLRAYVRWWPMGRLRFSFDAWSADSAAAPAPRGQPITDVLAWYEAWLLTVKSPNIFPVAV